MIIIKDNSTNALNWVSIKWRCISMSKLYRSKDDKIVSGIFGGFGEFFNIDANLLRIVGFLMFFRNPLSFLFFYFLAVMIIPLDQGIIYQDDSTNKSNSTIFMGVSLIVIGSYLTLKKIYPGLNFRFLTSFRLLLARISGFWPLLLIVLGLYLLANNDNKMGES